MRIQGELLKLGVSVSATTIATVLRRPGLGPAPRRIGPSWSEFLRAQAKSMLGGDLRSGMGAGLEDNSSERSEPAQEGEARQVDGWRPSSRGYSCPDPSGSSTAAGAAPPATACSPCRSWTVAPEAIASIARSRRTPKSRLALVSGPCLLARRQSCRRVASGIQTKCASAPLDNGEQSAARGVNERP
jgi:hypothetical protein